MFLVRSLNREGVAVYGMMFLWFSVSSAIAQVIQHRGAVDPLTEGFTGGSAGGASLGPVLNDFGIDAWSVDINAGTQLGFYRAYLTSDQQLGLSDGWTLSAVLRVAEVPDAGGGTLARFYAGAQMFPMYFGAQPDGDPFVRLGSSSELAAPSYILDGSGGGYHRYSLVYDPRTSSASLWIDDLEVITGFRGYNISAQPRVDWGGGQAITHANWSEVTLSVVPEPTAGSFLIAAVIAALNTRYSRRQGRDS